MRRRSERKKSTDVSSPAPASRRTRSRKSPSISETEKASVDLSDQNTEKESVEAGDGNITASSEERGESSSRRSRGVRNKTPVKERGSPSKKRNPRTESPNSKIHVIAEEENGSTTNAYDANVHADSSASGEESSSAVVDMEAHNEQQQHQQHPTIKEEVLAVGVPLPNSPTEEEQEEDNNNEDKRKHSDVLDIQEGSQEADEDEEEVNDLKVVVKQHSQEKFPDIKKSDIGSEDQPEEGEIQSSAGMEDAKESKEEVVHQKHKDTSISSLNETRQEKSSADTANKESTIKRIATSADTTQKPPQTNNGTSSNNIHADNVRQQRKRKWITRKVIETKAPILSISTDSLKNLIADVHPVPLSDVQLESSSEVEEVVSEREEGEESPSPEPERRRTSTDRSQKASREGGRRQSGQTNETTALGNTTQGAKEMSPVQRSPSPPRHNASCVLYITNLVRPFTVLQLKGLLARTGKIVEDGFWIDRIKSKCYVQYETEDEAIETRHALHGVRWPVSNPKCLNVDFGSKADMDRAIQSTKDDAPRFGHDNNKDNLIVGTGWNRERNDDEKKSVRPVREWDVGKKESLEREKGRDGGRDGRDGGRDGRDGGRDGRDGGRDGRDGGRDGRDQDKNRTRERDVSNNRDNERSIDRKNRSRGRDPRSTSLSPARKLKKKENDPPLRLLDDLFRKTKATPCIYWLPLTPEQIAEKEAFRQKRIEEHKERIKQRELERGKEREKEREKERNRGSDRERDRDRDHRRNRSSDRRRSRSRDRRRY